MHFANRLFWDRCRRKYPRYFAPPSKVIEFGSMNINSSIRDYFTATDYTGVDWRAGDKVDLVSLAHLVPFEDKTFDTVVSASMLEHDPYWEASLMTMARLMKDDGVLIISWGAAQNCPHEGHSAPDGKFHARPVIQVLQTLRHAGLHIHEFQYEKSILAEAGSDLAARSGHGETVLMAFRSRDCAAGEPLMDELLPEDKEPR